MKYFVLLLLPVLVVLSCGSPDTTVKPLLPGGIDLPTVYGAELSKIQKELPALDSWQILVNRGSRQIDVDGRIASLILGFVPGTPSEAMDQIAARAAALRDTVGGLDLSIQKKLRWSRDIACSTVDQPGVDDFLLGAEVDLQVKYAKYRVVLRNVRVFSPSNSVLFYACASVDTPAEVIQAIDAALESLVKDMDAKKDFSKVPKILVQGLGC